MPKDRHTHNSLPATRGLRIIPAPCTRPRNAYTPRNTFEAAALKVPPTLKLPDNFFPTDAEIDVELNAIDTELGADPTVPYQAEARRRRYHQRWNELFEKAGRDTMAVYGVRTTLLSISNGFSI